MAPSSLLESSWSFSPEGCAKHYGTNLATGLTDKQVEELRAVFGKNELAPEDPTPLWKLILKQFDDLLVKILIGAALVSLLLALMEDHGPHGFSYSSLVEPAVIIMILIVNATVGVVQETNAEKAIEALKSYEPDHATALRNGKIVTVDSADLVPGDVVEVATGNKIPADIRLVALQSTAIRCDQAILTGESVSVLKWPELVKDARAVNQDKINTLFKGTTVAAGKCRGIVVGTGANTEFGKIQKELSQTEEVQSPLKIKLDEFGELLSKVIAVICVVVWLINIGHFNDPVHGSMIKGAIYYFKIAVALAVAAIPEGLPAVVTTCLALGTKKMAKKNAIVRSLPSVETLGCTTVICSDKTGTLTTNMMSVQRVATVAAATGSVDEYEVQGTSYSPEGDIIPLNGKKGNLNLEENSSLKMTAVVSSLCNDSSIHYNPDKKTFEKIGEATETALKVLVEKLGLGKSSDSKNKQQSIMETFLRCNNHWSSSYPKLATLEFSRDRKSMSVICQDPAAKKNAKSPNVMFVKGAPESILDRSTQVLLPNGTVVPMNKKIRDALDQVLLDYGTGSNTLRCIGLAFKEEIANPSSLNLVDPATFVNHEQGLTFVSVVGMVDPPREEVKESISIANGAGIRVIVITGDNKNTAEAICRRIGVFGEDEDTVGLSYTGREFDDLSLAEQKKAVMRARLFSRTEPSHKSRLVDLLQGAGEVVAMTGDGVNDAPALKKADIGVAMGSGTAVAKEASEMVLADDNFATIVSAVEEGRAIFNNTKQFIRYLISSNIGEVVCIFLTAALGMPEALIPVQLLWVNLVTDGLPATALGFNPPEKGIMKQKPRSSTDSIVSGWLFIRYVVIGVYVGVAVVGGFAYWYLFYENGPQITWAQLTSFHSCVSTATLDCSIFRAPVSYTPSTISLSILVLIEMFNAFNSVSENQSIFVMSPFVNGWLIIAVIMSMILHFAILYVPVFATIFSVAPLSLGEWKIVFWLSAPIILIDEILKLSSRIYQASAKSNSVGAGAVSAEATPKRSTRSTSRRASVSAVSDNEGEGRPKRSTRAKKD